ncbi:hypothetical protein QUB70_26875 [Microcoleus sp. A003_D6]
MCKLGFIDRCNLNSSVVEQASCLFQKVAQASCLFQKVEQASCLFQKVEQASCLFLGLLHEVTQKRR